MLLPLTVQINSTQVNKAKERFSSKKYPLSAELKYISTFTELHRKKRKR